MKKTFSIFITSELNKRSTYPLDIFAKGLTEAGTEYLKLDVGISAAIFEIHPTRQARDVTLWSHRLHHSATRLANAGISCGYRR